MPSAAPDPIRLFIDRWQASGGAERANYQLFLTELCHLLGVPTPDATSPDDREDAYVFERSVTFVHNDGSTSHGRIDLYKRGCFVLEAKQGSDQKPDEPFTLTAAPIRTRRGTAIRNTPAWDTAMLEARGQAEQYARALPTEEGWPPFLIVVDVGHSLELYADFSGIGKAYTHFPHVQKNRIALRDLEKPEVRAQLRAIWTDPASLDPSRRSAKVTREVAARLAELAKSLEAARHAPEAVAHFLMRCLFTMFAEDVTLLPQGSFTKILKSLLEKPEDFAPMAEELWQEMKTGKKFSPILRAKVLHFNGGLFESAQALPLNKVQLELLIDASEKEWSEVEPAIFGTLLERALDPRERHKLGAHFTPRAYVERLVIPTVIEPLRQEWDAVKVAAVTLVKQDKRKDAIAEIQAFQHRLCELKILDPACGSGNFLYVTLDHLKRLEGETRDLLATLGETQGVFEHIGLTVDPHQLLGIEINPRAAAITDLVLWIGYLQWHFRTFGRTMPAEPVLKAFHNIECRDAVLAYDAKELLLDDQGRPVTRWDGHTTKTHPVTGKEVPDGTSTTPVFTYTNARKSAWPIADFVVGNPPFIGKLHITRLLGEGYVESLREVYAKKVPDGADYVMYWWYNASVLAANRTIRRFGFITTNSIRQPFNRRIVQGGIDGSPPIHLIFAVPDHPWVDKDVEGAAVRISMTIAEAGRGDGTLLTLREEFDEKDGTKRVEFKTNKGNINGNLSLGSNVSACMPLEANKNLASMGPALGSRGFVINEQKRNALIASDGARAIPRIRPLRNGGDLIEGPRGVFAIDLEGLTEDEVRNWFPTIYQHLFDLVRPERLQNRDLKLSKNWWLFRRSNELYRSMLFGLDKFIVTVETAKYRLFFFCDGNILAEHGTISFGFGNPFLLGVMSSKVHVTWALATGGTLEDRPRYNKTLCFDPFPFPGFGCPNKSQIAKLAEQIDTHRNRQQKAFPKHTFTDMYNVLEKLRTGEPLDEKEKVIHEQGLVSVLKQLHDELDRAVFEAYGWPTDLSDQEILQRLVALNAERAEEEERGLIRWLRPEYQNPQGTPTATQGELAIPTAETPLKPGAGKAKKVPWPKALPEQAQAVRTALAARSRSVTSQELAAGFLRANTDRIEELLQTLASLGQAREVAPGEYRN